MHQTQYNHLINVLHNEVAKATETSQICLLKTASVTCKRHLLDLKTFLLRVCSPTKQAAENFLGSNLEPTEPGAPYPRMFWVTYFVGPVLFTPRGLFFLAYVVIMPKNAPYTIQSSHQYPSL